MLPFGEIKAILTAQFGEAVVLSADEKALQPSLQITADKLPEVCVFLHQDERLYFDMLSCLTALDNGPEIATFEVIYHLYSIPFGHSLVLKTQIPRTEPAQMPSVSHVWQTANWHEREAYDLMGIVFINHPDLRRILMPDDWQGHPLRKDYLPQAIYHGITVNY